MPVNFALPMEKGQQWKGHTVISNNGPPASEAVQYCHLLSPETLKNQTQDIKKALEPTLQVIMKYQVGRKLKGHLIQPFWAKSQHRQDSPAPRPDDT